jgi:hypothetical protein
VRRGPESFTGYHMKISILALVAAAGLSILPASAENSSTAAVSAPNGKVSVTGGWDAATGNPGSFDFGGSAAFAVPLGDYFGFQGDVAAGQFAGVTSYSGAAHLFNRDPNAYLVGLVGGGVWTGSSSSYLVGPEAELYLGNITLGGSAAFVSNTTAGVTSSSYLASGDIKYYPMPNMKLELGAATFSGSKTAHVGAEWQFADQMPLTVSTTATVGDNNLIAANVGLTFYFGGTSKTLIDRHRHEDPANVSQLLVYYNGAYRYVNVAPGSVLPGTGTNGGTCPTGYVLHPVGCVPIPSTL